MTGVQTCALPILLRSGATGLQVVLGPIADQVAGEIRDAARGGAHAQANATQVTATSAEAKWSDRADVQAGAGAHAAQRQAPPVDASAVLAALGGRQNVAGVETFAGRLSLRVADPKAIDEGALGTLGIRGVAHAAAGSIQLLIPGSPEAWAQPLRRLLA